MKRLGSRPSSAVPGADQTSPDTPRRRYLRMPRRPSAELSFAQRVLVSTATQYTGSLLGILVSILFLRLSTGYLGLHGFGQLAIIFAVCDLLITLSDLGVSTTLTREIAKDPQRTNTLAGHFLRFRTTSAFAIVLLALLAIPLTPYSHQTRLALAISLVGVFATSLIGVPKAFFQLNLRLQRQAALDLSRKILNVAAMLVVIALDLGFYWLVILLAAVNVSVAAASFLLSGSYWRLNLRSLGAQGRRLIRSSVAVGLISVIGLLHYRGDAILLSLLAPAKDVGIYVVAYRFVDQAYLLPGMLLAVIFPTLTRYAHAKDDRRDLLVNRMFQLLLVAAVATAVAIFTLASPLVSIIAGHDFAPAALPARLLAPSLLFLFVSPVFYNLLIAVDRQRDLIAIGLSALAFNVGLNLVLIPRYSYNGAAVATVLSEGLAFAGTFTQARRIVGIGIDIRFVARVLGAASIAAAAIAVTLPYSAWLSFALSEATFLGGAFALRAIAPNDLRAIVSRRRI